MLHAGVFTIANLVEGAKIVAPVNTEIAMLDGNGAPLVWHRRTIGQLAYTVALAVFAPAATAA